MLTPADSSAGLSSEDVALNGRTLAMVGAKGSNPKLPELPARTKTGSELLLPGLSFGFFGEWVVHVSHLAFLFASGCLQQCGTRFLSELENPG